MIIQEEKNLLQRYMIIKLVDKLIPKIRWNFYLLIFFKGLRYIIDRFEGNCTIAPITPDSLESAVDGSYVTMKNASSFFHFDDVVFQYTGQVKKNLIIFEIYFKMFFI